MAEVAIVTDSTCDLPQDLIERHGIHIVPLKVTISGQVYQDRVDCDGAKVFEMVERTGVLPTTSAAAPADFAAVFERLLAEGKSIVYIGISSELSATVQNAEIARRDFPEAPIEIVDSRSLSTGVGLLVLKAVDYAAAGWSHSEIARELRDMTGRLKVEFVIDTLDYLHKGGRLTGLQRLIGAMLKIHPLVRVNDGKLELAEKLRGAQRKVILRMVDHIVADAERLAEDRVFITHAAAEESAEILKEQLLARLKVKEIIISEAGSVISSHCGPNTVGILYMCK